jgi:WD40 repeat protein
VFDVTFSSDGRQVVSASNDRLVRVWDPLSSRLVATLRGHERAVNAAVFTRDGRCVVSADDDGCLRLWDHHLIGAPALDIANGPSPACLEFSPDGRWAAIGTVRHGEQSASAIVVDLGIGRSVRQFPVRDRAVSRVAWSPNGQLLAASITGDKSRLCVWDVPQTRVLVERDFTFDSVALMQFSVDGGKLVVAVGDQLLVLASATLIEVERVRSPIGKIAGFAFRAAGLRVVGLDGRQAVVWDSRSSQPPRFLTGHSDVVTTAAISVDGRIVATGSADRTVRLWDAQSGTALGSPWPGHVGTVGAVVFSPDGRRLASAGLGYDQTTRIWDVGSGQELLVLQSESGDEPKLVFAPHGQRLATLRQGVALWDMRPDAASAIQERAIVAAIRFHLGLPLDRENALASLRDDRALPADLRHEAVLLAASWPENPDRYFRAAWAAARSPHESPDAYAQSLQWAERLLNDHRDRIEIEIVQGAALYRLGRTRDALAVLTKINDSSVSTDWSRSRRAFLAMTLAALKRTTEADAVLVQIVAANHDAEADELVKEAKKAVGPIPNPIPVK